MTGNKMKSNLSILKNKYQTVVIAWTEFFCLKQTLIRNTHVFECMCSGKSPLILAGLSQFTCFFELALADYFSPLICSLYANDLLYFFLCISLCTLETFPGSLSSWHTFSKPFFGINVILNSFISHQSWGIGLMIKA